MKTLTMAILGLALVGSAPAWGTQYPVEVEKAYAACTARASIDPSDGLSPGEHARLERCMRQQLRSWMGAERRIIRNYLNEREAN